MFVIRINNVDLVGCKILTNIVCSVQVSDEIHWTGIHFGTISATINHSLAFKSLSDQYQISIYHCSELVDEQLSERLFRQGDRLTKLGTIENHFLKKNRHFRVYAEGNRDYCQRPLIDYEISMSEEAVRKLKRLQRTVKKSKAAFQIKLQKPQPIIDQYEDEQKRVYKSWLMEAQTQQPQQKPTATQERIWEAPTAESEQPQYFDIQKAEELYVSRRKQPSVISKRKRIHNVVVARTEEKQGQKKETETKETTLQTNNRQEKQSKVKSRNEEWPADLRIASRIIEESNSRLQSAISKIDSRLSHRLRANSISPTKLQFPQKTQLLLLHTIIFRNFDKRTECRPTYLRIEYGQNVVETETINEKAILFTRQQIPLDSRVNQIKISIYEYINRRWVIFGKSHASLSYLRKFEQCRTLKLPVELCDVHVGQLFINYEIQKEMKRHGSQSQQKRKMTEEHLDSRIAKNRKYSEKVTKRLFPSIFS